MALSASERIENRSAGIEALGALRTARGDTEPTRTLDFLPQLIIRGSTQRP